MSKWEIISLIVTFIGLLIFIFGAKIYYEVDEPFVFLIGSILSVLGIFGYFGFSYTVEINKMEMIKESPQEYSFYLDGEDVDYDKIDLDQYDISYDFENKKVFLTRK